MQRKSPPAVSGTRAGARVRRAWLIALLATAVSATASAQAIYSGDASEREQLALIEHELARVQTMIAEAAQTAPTGQRVKFRYDWLSHDLQLVRDGITQHIDAPRQPRPVPPLRGDYRR